MRTCLFLPRRAPNTYSVVRASLGSILDPKKPFNYSSSSNDLRKFAEILLSSPIDGKGILQPHRFLSATALQESKSNLSPHFIDACARHIKLSSSSRNRLNSLNTWLADNPHTIMILYQQPINWMLPHLLENLANNLKPYTPNLLEAAVPTLNRRNESLLVSFHAGSKIESMAAKDQRFSIAVNEFEFPVHRVLECYTEQKSTEARICI